MEALVPASIADIWYCTLALVYGSILTDPLGSCMSAASVQLSSTSAFLAESTWPYQSVSLLANG
jgi:hypothetical protein